MAIKKKVPVVSKVVDPEEYRHRKETHYRYPTCPTCGNREYKFLDTCVACTKLVCDLCKGTHEFE